MRLATLVLALSLAACGETYPSENTPNDGRQITVRRAQVFVIAPDRVVPADELAAAVRASGHPCEAVTGLGQLELKGRALDNYKLECGERAYLLTWLEGDSRIKPWSDEIFDRP
jgi:hypothetical protein